MYINLSIWQAKCSLIRSYLWTTRNIPEQYLLHLVLVTKSCTNHWLQHELKPEKSSEVLRSPQKCLNWQDSQELEKVLAQGCLAPRKNFRNKFVPSITVVEKRCLKEVV